MAAFNPPMQSDLGTNYTGYSQGQTPNKALGELFSGIADAVRIKKKTDQDGAQADIQNQVDQIAVKGMGGNPTSDLFVTPKDGASGKASPPELNAAQNTLDRYRQAYNQGTMSDIYFSTQVATLSKKLRTKYPGLERQIDAMISSAIGTSTANDVRRNLENVFKQEQAAASSEDKQRLAMLEKYDKYLADPEFNVTYEKLTKSKFDMHNFNRDAFLYAASIQEAADADLERRTKKLALLNSESERDRKTAKSIAMEGAAKTRDRLLYTGLNTDHGSEGTNFTKLQGLIDKSLAGDNTIDANEKKAIEQVMAMTEVELNRYADQYLSQNKLDSLLPNSSDREDVKQVILEPFNVIKNAMTNKEYGVLDGLKRDSEARKLAADNKFLSQDDGISKYVGTAKELFGSDIVESYFRKMASNQNMTDEEKAVGAKINMMLRSGKPLSEVLSSAVTDGGLTKGSVAMGAIESYVQDLSNPNVSKEAASKAAEAIFSETENGSLSKFTTADNTRLFDLFTNSALVDKLKNTDAGEKMYGWARNQAKFMLKPLADQIANTQVFSDAANITFNPKSGRFELAANQDSIIGMVAKGPALTAYDKYKQAKGAQAVSLFNHYLDQVEPIITANGEKMDVFLNELFIGRDYKSLQKQGSVFSIMVDSFYKSVQQSLDGVQKDKKQGDTSPPPLAPNMPRPDLEGRSGLDIQGSIRDVQNAEQILASVSDKPIGAIKGLDDKFAVNLANLLSNAPPELKGGLGLFSAYRDVKHQKELWDKALKKYGSVQEARRWVAPPGHSQHNKGLAADLSWNGKSLAHAPAHVVAWVHENAPKYGLHFPLGNENWHIEPIGVRGKKKTRIASN